MSERHNYGSSFYNLTLRKHFKQEVISFLGRLISFKKIQTDKKYLQLGCGEDDVDDKFLNCDFFTFESLNPFLKKKLYYLDLRYPLPFNNNKFEGVFSEHTIEHLYSSEAKNLFKEIHRVLSKNGIFRVITPDLKKYINYYVKGEKFIDREFKFGCEAIWNISNNFGHKSVWDSEWLIYQLKEAGFKEVVEVKCNTGENKDLLIDKEGREAESLYVEAKK